MYLEKVIIEKTFVPAWDVTDEKKQVPDPGRIR
jgi:hypothetical protein